MDIFGIVTLRHSLDKVNKLQYPPTIIMMLNIRVERKRNTMTYLIHNNLSYFPLSKQGAIFWFRALKKVQISISTLK